MARLAESLFGFSLFGDSAGKTDAKGLATVLRTCDECFSERAVNHA